jgi:RecJ-like exonuclease
METLGNAVGLGMQDKMFLHTAGRSKFEAIFGSDMRPLFVILALLLCLIVTRANEQQVIKDSEAARYVGGYVEVRGLVVSVRTSPLGTSFINFGRDYPNQTFAGFIAAGSKIATDQRIAMLQGKIIGITGKIELHRGKPEIKVLSMNQIKAMDLHPVR